MSLTYQIKKETRQRCRIWPISVNFINEFRILTMEQFGIFYDSDVADFSIFLQVGNEVIEYVKPSEFHHKEYLDQVRDVMEKNYDHVYLMIKKEDEKKYTDYGRRVRREKINKLLSDDPSLDRSTIEIFTDLTSATQLVVKGGITPEVADFISNSTGRMINEMIGNKHVMSTLSRMVQMDPSLYDHSASVSIIAGTIATTVLSHKLSTKIAELVAICGIYHDIGKSEIPNHILNKPGIFEPHEFEIMKTHTLKGYEELCRLIGDGAPIPDIAARVALEHHEKFDGTGYPHGKRGRAEDDPDNGIHIITRIITIANVYSALLMKRAYKPSYDAAESLKIMSEGSGLDYDPELFIPF
ncbi:MAG: HD domain-containing protein, partial [Oligoflexales bacterium]|nr:HD domain-containing protein [Oligoflexales bacterium]